MVYPLSLIYSLFPSPFSPLSQLERSSGQATAARPDHSDGGTRAAVFPVAGARLAQLPRPPRLYRSAASSSFVEIREATATPASSPPQIRRCSSPAAASTRHRRAGAAAARWWRSAARSSSSRRLQVTLWCRGAAFKLADSAILGLGALGRASRMVPAMRSWV